MSREDANAEPDGARGVVALLDQARQLDDLARGFEAFREGARGLGLLDASRSGERVQDGWDKLAHLFLQPLRSALEPPAGDGRAPGDVFHESSTASARWERAVAEVKAFFEEQSSLERELAGSPAGAHLGYRTRSRLLVLDQRAERIQVACDLVRRQLLERAREEAAKLESVCERVGGPP